MPAQQTTIEFHDAYCRIFVWQVARNELTLERQVHVSLEPRPVAPEAGLAVPEPGVATPMPDQQGVIERNGAAIREALKGAGLRIRDAMVVIPKQWVTLRVVKLPSADPGELAEMARFEAERHIPFDAARHVVSHHVARADEIEGSQVVIAALDQPPAEEVTGTLEAAGITLRNLDVSSTALFNALTQSEQWGGEEETTVAQINIGDASTDINILHEGDLVFARSIALGVDRLLGEPAPMASPAIPEPPVEDEEVSAVEEEAPKAPPIDIARLRSINIRAAMSDESLASDDGPAQWLNRLIQEVQRTYGYARREFDCHPLTRVFVSGIGTTVPEIDGVLRMALDADTELLKPFGEGLKYGLKGDEDDLSDAACALAAGALKNPKHQSAARLNLLPPSYIRKHVSSRRKQSLVTTVTLIVALIVCAFVFADQTMRERKRQLAYYAAQVEKSQARAQELERKRMVLKILKQNSSREGSPLAILDTISTWKDMFAPGQVRVGITEFNFETQRFLKIAGYSRSYKDLDEFILRLEQSGHFENVRLQSRPLVSAPNAPRMQVARFTLMCYFRGAKNRADYDY